MGKFLAVTRRLVALCMIVALTACATGPKLVTHGFSFNGWFDKWATQVDLLEYSYGDQYSMVRNSVANPRSENYKGLDALPPASGVNGAMPVGEFLYVKWRIKETGEVIEDRVDLRDRLAKNMFDHRLTFVIDDTRLYIYLVTPHAKAKGHQDLRTYLSHSYVTYEIYPNNTYKP